MLTGAGLAPSVAALLARHGLAGAAEAPLEHDGWSGARLTRLESADRTYVLKRDALAWDWIARATRDDDLREAWLAAAAASLRGGLTAPYFGAARDGEGVAMLMPDLGERLFAWERGIDAATLDRVLGALAEFHRAEQPVELPWCPLPERLLLLTRPAAERYAAEGLPVGPRFLAGWDAFDRVATPRARALVADQAGDPAPLLAALAARPAVLLHGDLKLANLGFLADGRLAAIDWQMLLRGPVAVDLGWFMVANAAGLPATPDAVLARYAALAGWDDATRSAEADLAVLVGLLLRGWRKGLDAEAGLRLPSGVSAADDLAWWCDATSAAAARCLAAVRA
ncbi:MAG: phosphotransferase [Candidatus Limnocylindrales bacterium]